MSNSSPNKSERIVRVVYPVSYEISNRRHNENSQVSKVPLLTTIQYLTGLIPTKVPTTRVRR